MKMDIDVVSNNTERSSTLCVIKSLIGHIPSCPAWSMLFSLTIDFKPISWKQDFNGYFSKSPILINFRVELNLVVQTGKCPE